MLRYTGCNIMILMAATAWVILSFSSCILCGFDSYTALFKVSPEKISPPPLRGRGGRNYRNWRTKSATQLQPSNSLCYIGYISTWLDVRSCELMQEAITFNTFYDGISFQNLVTILISVCTLCYGPGLLFRGPSCISLRTQLFIFDKDRLIYNCVTFNFMTGCTLTTYKHYTQARVLICF